MEPARRDRAVVFLSIAIFAALSLAASVTSRGFLEADGCTHYLYARYAFSEPHYLVNIWGRPICTALYAIPAQLGERFGVRCMSMIVAIGVAIVAYAIAQPLRLRRPALALLFTLAQPLVFLHSFAELTELPFALLLGLTFLAYQRERWGWFAVLASILPLARPEGFVLLILAGIALVLHRRMLWLLAIPIPLILWSYVGWRMYGSDGNYPWYLWLVRNWPYADKSTYQRGSIAHFALLLPAIVSPLATPALLLGIWQSLRHRTRTDVLTAIIPMMILVGHSILYATGRLASSGEIRYMLIVAPFWAILVARGWEWFFGWRGWQRFEMKIAALAAIVPILCNRTYQVVPLIETEDWLHAQRAAQWVQSTSLSRDYPRMQTAHPGIYYFLGVSQSDANRSVEWRLDLLQHPRPGTILIWDWIYATHNADRSRVAMSEELTLAGWVPIRVPPIENATRDHPGSWQVFLSPTDIEGGSTRSITSGPRGQTKVSQ